MRFNSSHAKQYLAAAIVASLLQGVVIAAPVFAETVSTSETTAAQESRQRKAAASTDSTVAQPETAEQNAIDHSAEFKPVRNVFLREGEYRPGIAIPYNGNVKLTKEEMAEEKVLLKDIKKLQEQRESFLKNCAKEKNKKDEAFANAFKNRQEYSIDFDPDDYTKKTMNANGETVSFRAYENLVYVKKPYDPESQMLSVYIPEPYFNGGTVNGFTAETAPIFMPNGVGGYMPGQIVEPKEDSRHGGANAVLYALSNGYVVVSPAIRGRSLKHKNGYETGKAPALIVDYKAAVRFVRYNRKAGRIPAGDTEKIISSGTSAGGALSALLGATGNAKDYDSYLKELGAAHERDDIFASMAYCPVTNLENADMAYEWMFHNANEYYSAGQARRMPVADRNASPVGAAQNRPANAPAEAAKGTAITPEQKKISAELKGKFTEYLNELDLRDSLGNRMNLAPDGNGIFREYIESLYLESAQNAIDTGEDVSQTPWLTVSDGTAVHMDFDKYIATVKRLKGVPAFDAFDMTTGENNEFGTYDIPNKHFTRYGLEHSNAVKVTSLKEEETAQKEKEEALRLASSIEKLRLQKVYLQEQMEKDKLDLTPYMADSNVVTMMNPMSFIGRANVQTAPNWRIRHGALDRDTALAIPAMLAVKLKNNDKAVDFKVAWDYGHDGDYDLPELFAWTDRICKIKDKADAILKDQQKKAKEQE
ncbi:MAG: hypothetical protein IJ858_02270 [Acidaminococcaceae bacterium]|nr:hypothetical protein [Acidaminococcaceae bacterium]